MIIVCHFKVTYEILVVGEHLIKKLTGKYINTIDNKKLVGD
jgi:hypothetical protein